MKNAIIFHHGKRIGVLREDETGFLFSYDESIEEPISLTFPVSGKTFFSKFDVSYEEIAKGIEQVLFDLDCSKGALFQPSSFQLFHRK